MCSALYLSVQKRFLNDRVINASLIDVLQGRSWIKTPWSQLAVGDIVKVCHIEHLVLVTIVEL